MNGPIRWALIAACLYTTGCTATFAPSLDEQHEALKLIDDGAAYLRQNKIDEAEAAFRVSLSLAVLPQSVDGLGCVAFRRGDTSKAAALFVQAFELDNRYVDALANLALLHDFNGAEESAQTLYERVLAYDPRNARARNNFSGILFDKQERAQARAELLMAQAVTKHSVIVENLKMVDSN